jgi:membrane protein implicated in regulation of membrane protease activity
LAVGAISVAVVPFAAGWPGAIQIVLVAVIAVACVVGFVSFVLSGSATASEYAAGYSTLTGRAYRHLWQLDAKTGAVVRPPDPPEPD